MGPGVHLDRQHPSLFPNMSQVEDPHPPFPGATAIHAPAKVNLFLAVTGVRPDGFHDLVSLVAPLGFGDTLWTAPANADHFSCNHPELDTGPSNLVSKALRLYRERTGHRQGIRIHLDKQIPMGSGFGGGSSDAAAILKAVNKLNPHPLDAHTLSEIAAETGSDCPLFLHSGPVWMEGRGERIHKVGESLRTSISGQPVLIFHPGFEVSTVWAYRELRASAPDSYSSPEQTTLCKSSIESTPSLWRKSVKNDLYRPVARKFLAIPALLQALQDSHRLTGFMSGSGSGCFALPVSTHDTGAIRQTVLDAWGTSAFFTSTVFL